MGFIVVVREPEEAEGGGGWALLSVAVLSVAAEQVRRTLIIVPNITG